MLPDPNGILGTPGLSLDHAAPASSQLLADLRSDKGMEWIPQTAWLTKVGIDAAAADLRFDLAIDASGMAGRRCRTPASRRSVRRRCRRTAPWCGSSCWAWRSACRWPPPADHGGGAPGPAGAAGRGLRKPA